MGQTMTAFALVCIVTAVAAYFLGCINGAILTARVLYHDDIRKHGSGNAGLTNFVRAYGSKGVAGVLLCDILKAVAAAALGGFLFGYFLGLPMIGKLLATTFVLLGHMFPVTFGFHGGKGILSGVSALLLVDWRIALISLGLFFVVVALTRYVSLGSICAVVTFAVCLWLFYHDVTLEVLGAIPAALVIFAHRANISRLLQGTESKFTLHKKEKEEGAEQ
jgi:glycerol-3-phosphate acyltransferase PlsY